MNNNNYKSIQYSENRWLYTYNIGKVVLPRYDSTHNHISYTFHNCEEQLAVGSLTYMNC